MIETTTDIQLDFTLSNYSFDSHTWTIPIYQNSSNQPDGNTTFTLIWCLRENDFVNCGGYIP